MIHCTIKTASLLLLLLIFLPVARAQNSTSSPFSIFGIGEIETRDFGRTIGMGNVGIGFQSENFLNRRNPAGLTAIDTLRFILDVSAVIKFSQYRNVNYKEQATNFNFKNLSAGVRLSKRWTSSVGLSPYSNVGYNIKTEEPIQGTSGEETVYFSGNGGVNKFYWANAFELFRGFSTGVTSSYIFGNYAHNEEMSGYSIKNSYRISKFYFDFGAQYSHWFGQYTNITAGGIYGYQSKMPIQQTEVFTSNMMIEKSKRKPDMMSYLPEFYGAGFSILRNKKTAEWIFAADYRYQNWAIDRSIHKELTYTDSHTYSAGFQLTPNKRRAEKYIHIMRFQLGACYNQSYLKVKGYQLEDYSVSLGVGLPFFNVRTMGGSPSYVNVSVIAGESSTRGNRGGITERYVLLSVNLSLIERWFAKRQWE